MLERLAAVQKEASDRTDQLNAEVKRLQQELAEATRQLTTLRTQHSDVAATVKAVEAQADRRWDQVHWQILSIEWGIKVQSKMHYTVA